MEVYVIPTNVIWFLSYIVASFVSFPIHSIHTKIGISLG